MTITNDQMARAVDLLRHAAGHPLPADDGCDLSGDDAIAELSDIVSRARDLLAEIDG